MNSAKTKAKAHKRYKYLLKQLALFEEEHRDDFDSHEEWWDLSISAYAIYKRYGFEDIPPYQEKTIEDEHEEGVPIEVWLAQGEAY